MVTILLRFYVPFWIIAYHFSVCGVRHCAMLCDMMDIHTTDNPYTAECVQKDTFSAFEWMIRSYCREAELCLFWFAECFFLWNWPGLASDDRKNVMYFMDWFVLLFTARWLVKQIVACSRRRQRNGLSPFCTFTSCDTWRLEGRKYSCRRWFCR